MSSDMELFAAVDAFLAAHPEPRTNASSRFVAELGKTVLVKHIQTASLEDRLLTTIVLVHHERDQPRDTRVDVDAMTALVSNLGQALLHESLRRQKALVPLHPYPPECSIFSSAWDELTWGRGPRYQEVLDRADRG